MRFAYTRRGGPLLDWSGVTPPYPTRAGETRSLGDWYATTRTSGALRRYGGRPPRYGGSAIPYERDRQLGDWYSSTRNSNAVRKYGGRGPQYRGTAIDYERDRRLGYWGSDIGSGSGTGYHPAPGMGDLPIPLPGAPEMIEGYEDPAPGAAIIHLGNGYPWNQKYPGQTSLSGYMPEGAARKYGQQMLGADAPKPAPFNMGLVRKASALASAYHGVKRNSGSVWWGLVWGLAGYVAPFYGTLVPAFAIAQGFAQPKVRTNPARRYRRRRR